MYIIICGPGIYSLAVAVLARVAYICARGLHVCPQENIAGDTHLASQNNYGTLEQVLYGQLARLPFQRSESLVPRLTGRTITGARLAVPGASYIRLPYPVVPDAPSRVPGLPSPVPGSRSMSLPADIPSLASDDRYSQGRGVCLRTDRMREPEGRMQVKMYCIPDSSVRRVL